MRKVVNSLHLLAFLFPDVPDYPPGQWFLLPESEILGTRNRQFSNKTGKRPVVVERVSGPNVIAYPRSSTIGGSFRHKAHSHSDTSCAIDRDGFVPFDCPCTVSVEALTEDRHSCFEPEDSELMAELEKVKAA